MSFVFETHFDYALAQFAQSDVSQPARSWRHSKFVLCAAVATYRVCSGCVFQNKMVLFRPNTTIVYNLHHPSTATCFGFFVIKPTRCTNFTNMFCHGTLHVSDSSSVHHLEFIHCTLSDGMFVRPSS